MREVIAICESSGKARDRAATVLDRYLWRIGRRTWRGRASNACLERISKELRKAASKTMAVSLFEVRSAYESRAPLLFVGSRSRFGVDGAFTTRTSAIRRGEGPVASAKAALVIAALFHDLGKSGRAFQEKLDRALMGDMSASGDPVRHELISALIFDSVFGHMDDEHIIERLRSVSPTELDAVWSAEKMASRFVGDAVKLDFMDREGSLAQTIGMLILTHHRLPLSGDVNMGVGRHVRPDLGVVSRAYLELWPGSPVWHDSGWIGLLHKAASRLRPAGVPAYDLLLRTCLMLGDHLGSIEKQPGSGRPVYLANTLPGVGAADDLLTHTRRVVRRSAAAFEACVSGRHAWPALIGDEVPEGLRRWSGEPERFAWQGLAAEAAADAAKSGGGFFACLMAGTGSGKTRGAPRVLAAATLADPDPARRGLRFVLGLGLRTLASQSARDYVDDIGFQPRDVQVMIGTPPIEIPNDEEEAADGSESGASQDDWFEITDVDGGVPEPGSPDEEAWLRGLSLDTDRRIPEIIESYARHKSTNGARLLRAPVICGTIDQIMPSAAPYRSRHLFASMRVMTSDLIIDEVDQFSPEDLAAVGRLCWQVGASGRRLIIASATVTPMIAEALFQSYKAGWSQHARLHGAEDACSVVIAGDAPGTVRWRPSAESLTPLVSEVIVAQNAALAAAPPRRLVSLPPTTASWANLVTLISDEVSCLHDGNHEVLGGSRVSVGFVRLSRVKHAVDLTVALDALPQRPERQRLLICLHSRFPALHRAWIESRLKAALTRKGADPNAGLRRLLGDLPVRPEAQDLEIVLVCTQVIETGNDLDFDWAVLDPSEARSVVQASGRVLRHRSRHAAVPNVSLLGHPVVAMLNGKLLMPGVETSPSLDTKVLSVSLKSRLTSDLFPLAASDRIDASLMTSDTACVLRDKEADLTAAFLTGTRGPSLMRFAESSKMRLSETKLRMRVFRRTTRPESTLRLMDPTDEIGPGVWMRQDGFEKGRNEVVLDASGVVLRNAAFPDLPRLARDAVDPGRDRSVGSWSEARVPVKDNFVCVFHPVLGTLPFPDADIGVVRTSKEPCRDTP